MNAVVWHEYRPMEGTPIEEARREILCGGHWYPEGASPCEKQDAAALADMMTLPACEQDDTVAAEALLGLSRCRIKPRGSWTAEHVSYPAAPPEKTPTIAIKQAGRSLRSWVKEAVSA